MKSATPQHFRHRTIDFSAMPLPGGKRLELTAALGTTYIQRILSHAAWKDDDARRAVLDFMVERLLNSNGVE